MLCWMLAFFLRYSLHLIFCVALRCYSYLLAILNSVKFNSHSLKWALRGNIMCNCAIIHSGDIKQLESRALFLDFFKSPRWKRCLEGVLCLSVWNRLFIFSNSVTIHTYKQIAKPTDHMLHF